VTPSDLRALVEAQRGLHQAEAASREAASTLADAKRRLRRAQGIRRRTLKATLDGTPEAMKAAAQAMGVSLARVYQLTRDYDRRRKPHTEPGS
jgi:hypothetical protein